MYKGKVNVKSEVSTEKLEESIINGIYKLNTEPVVIGTGEKFLANYDDNLNSGVIPLTANMGEIIKGMSETGNAIGSSMKSVYDRITDKNIYHIVLKSGMEVECFATDMTNILEMMSNNEVYIVQENANPGYSTFIEKDKVAYFRIPTNSKTNIKPFK